jgi:hypothetical protein
MRDARVFSTGIKKPLWRVGTDAAVGRIKRFDAPHVLLVEPEAERADVLFQALGAHGFRNGDQTAVEMPVYKEHCSSLISADIKHLVSDGRVRSQQGRDRGRVRPLEGDPPPFACRCGQAASPASDEGHFPGPELTVGGRSDLGMLEVCRGSA